MIILDGGMGTQLQAHGLRSGEYPEDWNLAHPDIVGSIHRAYAEAGASVAYTNTFGANRLKYHGRYPLDEVIAAGVKVARESVPATVKVALDIGPSGCLLKPIGDMSVDAVYEAFAEAIRAGVAVGVDLIVIETMSDPQEMKAAVLAAKNESQLPIYATFTMEECGKTLTGASVECVALLLESLGVNAIGFNCGLGADKMLPLVERLARVTSKPIIARANAGIPRMNNAGHTEFALGPDEYAECAEKLAAAGATIVGGCCGTTPQHIRKVCEKISAKSFFAGRGAVGDSAETAISSGNTVVRLHPHDGLIIGERINPTGKKLLKAALIGGDTAYVMREAVKQVDSGARVLDVNCGIPGIDEARVLDETIALVQSVATCPIQIDTADARALEMSLRHVNGKPLVNSVNGKRASVETVLPLVKRYGGSVVALCLDENGIPATAEGRIAIARRILSAGERYGIDRDDFVFDALTLAVSADPNAAKITLETVRRLTDELHVNTVLGVSNVSFGLPNRIELNKAMYTLAKRAGLSAAIANPAAIGESDNQAAFDVLLGNDPNCERWIAANQTPLSTGTSLPTATASDDLVSAVRNGLREDARSVAKEMLAGGKSAMEIITAGIAPALETVGAGFENGKVFLPQLLMAADAAAGAFDVVKANMTADASSVHSSHGRPIVIATVKGDIHDIGKNIVRALLENFGFQIIDLGKDVPPEKIVKSAMRENAMMVGLSALMTTTVGAMAETIRQLKSANLGCKTVVGGAVITEDFARAIGADFYAKDAMRTVRIAESLLST